jgi:hypothetical protein
MTGAKQLPIAAAIAGFLAAVGLTVKLATTTDPLEGRVDEVLARVSKPKTVFPENLQTDIDELMEVLNDPGFSKLPAAKQEGVRQWLKASKIFRSYKDFETQVSDLPDPRSARSVGPLKEIIDRLNRLDVPEQVPESLQRLEGIRLREELMEARRVESARRYADLVGDAANMQLEFENVQKEYQKVISAAKQVLENKNEPNLPGRIQEVLELSKNLKTPQNDKDKPLPFSRLTYASVFQLSETKSLIEEWIKLKNQLEPALKAKSP